MLKLNAINKFIINNKKTFLKADKKVIKDSEFVRHRMF